MLVTPVTHLLHGCANVKGKLLPNGIEFLVRIICIKLGIGFSPSLWWSLRPNSSTAVYLRHRAVFAPRFTITRTTAHCWLMVVWPGHEKLRLLIPPANRCRRERNLKRQFRS